MIPGELGLFAVRSICKGTVLSESNKMGDNYFIKWEQLERLKDSATKKIIKDFALGTPDGFYSVIDFNYLSMPWFMNHSCNGCVGFDKHGNFITLKNIKNGEELTWDYGLGESNPKFKMECLCGNENCRKIITGNDWKNKSFVEKNKQNMLPDLLKLIKS